MLSALVVLLLQQQQRVTPRGANSVLYDYLKTIGKSCTPSMRSSICTLIQHFELSYKYTQFQSLVYKKYFFYCSFSSEGEDIIVSGVYAECADAAAREAAYRLYLAPDKRQHELLTTTLDARHEMASICGFNSYADR